MDNYASRLDLVKRKIRGNFSDTSFPVDENVVLYPAGHSEEYDTTAGFFRGRQWAEITPEIFHSKKCDLWTLTNRAFRYFLPGFMLVVLENPDELSENTDILVHALIPDRKIECFVNRTRTDCYTPEQLSAIQEFLRVYRAVIDDDPGHFDVDKALAFWESVE